MRRKARPPTGPGAHSPSGRGSWAARRRAAERPPRPQTRTRRPRHRAWCGRGTGRPRAGPAGARGGGLGPRAPRALVRGGRGADPGGGSRTRWAPEEPTCSAPGRVTTAERADVRRLGGEGAARPAPDAAACAGAQAPRGRQAGPRRPSGRKPLVGVRGRGSRVSLFLSRL